ncbi:MAG: pro-sigmaK processing inhibitor BofA family protein [Oscillospiraceae bacterium]|jgi:LPXTG-motif cell wall-anchored protein|nr:pro-sigmaK processing inhibitor BofA family protein [Oscillospiraceae bacterium]
MERIIENSHFLLYIGALLILLIFYIRRKKRIRTFLLGGTSGLASLVLLHLYGGVIGFTPTLCWFNLAVSVLLGIPGVVMLYLAELFLT